MGLWTSSAPSVSLHPSVSTEDLRSLYKTSENTVLNPFETLSLQMSGRKFGLFNVCPELHWLTHFDTLKCATRCLLIGLLLFVLTWLAEAAPLDWIWQTSIEPKQTREMDSGSDTAFGLVYANVAINIQDPIFAHCILRFLPGNLRHSWLLENLLCTHSLQVQLFLASFSSFSSGVIEEIIIIRSTFFLTV